MLRGGKGSERHFAFGAFGWDTRARRDSGGPERHLKGPGLLVLGQPFFANEGSFTDYGLPDFRQYEKLKRHLRASEHTIVILTGDVHFGRVAIANLRPELGTNL